MKRCPRKRTEKTVLFLVLFFCLDASAFLLLYNHHNLESHTGPVCSRSCQPTHCDFFTLHTSLFLVLVLFLSLRFPPFFSHSTPSYRLNRHIPQALCTPPRVAPAPTAPPAVQIDQFPLGAHAALRSRPGEFDGLEEDLEVDGQPGIWLVWFQGGGMGCV